MTDAQRANIARILQYNAERCENATHPHCVCRCRGAMHGRPHSPAWVTAQLAMIEAAHAIAELDAVRLSRAAQPDLFA